MNTSTRLILWATAAMDTLSYGELAALAEWMYASLPDSEKEPGLTWGVAHHVQMARALDAKNYRAARAFLARMETHGASGRCPARERRAMARVS